MVLYINYMFYTISILITIIPSFPSSRLGDCGRHKGQHALQLRHRAEDRPEDLQHPSGDGIRMFCSNRNGDLMGFN